MEDDHDDVDDVDVDDDKDKDFNEDDKLKESFSEISLMAFLLLFLTHVLCLRRRDDDDEDDDDDDQHDASTGTIDAKDCSIIRLSSPLKALETMIISSRFGIKQWQKGFSFGKVSEMIHMICRLS